MAPTPPPPTPANPSDAPVPCDSSAGEEDPGASLGDPVLRDAMQGEAHAAGKPTDGDPLKPSS